MPVDYSDGVAKQSFYMYQHPGPDDPYDWPQEMREAAGESQAMELARKASGGDWIIVSDGRGQVYPPGSEPWRIEGKTGPGGFGFGGLDAELGILNRSHVANRSFSVESDRVEGGWITKVDGEVVERGGIRPFYIGWSANDGSGGFL